MKAKQRVKAPVRGQSIASAAARWARRDVAAQRGVRSVRWRRLRWLLGGAGLAMIWAGSLVGLTVWMSRVPYDAHAPAYASRPYAPFTRQAAIAIARREWRAWGEVVVDEPSPPSGVKLERQEGLWQRVGDYWWEGVSPTNVDTAWTGMHDDTGTVFPADQDGVYAWSAAFVDYVMRVAGARDLFPYAVAHADYINAAALATRGEASKLGIRAEKPEVYAPRPGDLICAGRHDAARMRYDDLPAPHFASHCAIVVDKAPGLLSIIGGNVADAVALTHVPTTPDGLLVNTNGQVLDERYSWFVIVVPPYQG